MGRNSVTWLGDGEKYALGGLRVKTEGTIPSGQMSPNLWTLVDTSFGMPSNWREWLGSIRADEVTDCNLFLLSKQPSKTPDTHDAENKRLEQLAWNFYVGLLLSSTFAPAHRPVLLSGARRGDQIDVRQQQDFDVPYPRVFHPYPAVVANDVRLAADLGESLDALATAPLQGGHWRLFRTLSVYTEGRVASQIIDRIHQYSRCIDGVILPDIGKTKQQFRSRTELFIGPHQHRAPS